MAGHADPNGRRGLPSVGRGAASPVDQDSHAAGRASPSSDRHVHRRDSAPARCRALRSRPRGNVDERRAVELRVAAVGAPDPSSAREAEPHDVADYLRWFIDNDAPPTGSGPNGLADFCQQVLTYWAKRNAPNVHLFHYHDLWENLAEEMPRVASALGITVNEGVLARVRGSGDTRRDAVPSRGHRTRGASRVLARRKQLLPVWRSSRLGVVPHGIRHRGLPRTSRGDEPRCNTMGSRWESRCSPLTLLSRVDVDTTNRATNRTAPDRRLGVTPPTKRTLPDTALAGRGGAVQNGPRSGRSSAQRARSAKPFVGR